MPVAICILCDVNIPSITFDIIFSTYSRHIPYRLYSYQTFQRYVYSVSIHFHYCANSQCTKVEKIALITWPVRGVLRGRRVFTPYKNLSYCDCYTIRIYKILVMGCSSNPKVIDWLNFAKLHYFKICGYNYRKQLYYLTILLYMAHLKSNVHF